MIEDKQLYTPLLINLHVKRLNGRPALEFRRVIMEQELIKAVVAAAFYKRPLIVQPVVSDEFRALATLCDVGLVYRDGEEYFFTMEDIKQ